MFMVVRTVEPTGVVKLTVAAVLPPKVKPPFICKAPACEIGAMPMPSAPVIVEAGLAKVVELATNIGLLLPSCTWKAVVELVFIKAVLLTVSVPAMVVLPAALTLNLEVGEEPDCRSSRLPLGDALVLEAKIKAWPLVGLPLAVTVSAELVLVPLSSLRTPEAMALLELVKV